MKTCVCAKGQRCSCLQKIKNGVAWKLPSALNFRQLLNKLNRLENYVSYIWENKYPCLHTKAALQKQQQRYVDFQGLYSNTVS